ncbi:hypothetical protein FACS1894202_09260 [Clostridia bacterium]|nr:hypothetical protein FACS1894202_09260 [Clostridia bacterium]
MKRKRFTAIAIVFCMILTVASLPALAVVGPSTPMDAEGNPIATTTASTGVTTLNHNSTHTYDFALSAGWMTDFNNGVFLFSNDNRVKVTYVSNTPSNSTAQVKITLAKKDSSGNYQVCAGINYYLTTSTFVDIVLPDKTTYAEYRLMFTNLDSAVTSGKFKIATHYDNHI